MPDCHVHLFKDFGAIWKFSIFAGKKGFKNYLYVSRAVNSGFSCLIDLIKETV